MICFPNAKINLGLNITEKRPDGFHNIETVFYKVGWQDALEVVVLDSARTDNKNQSFNLHLSGIPIHGELKDNLLFKAYQLISKFKSVPAIDVYLHKHIPMGAGLGGGSADAAFFINLLNNQFNLKLTIDEKTTIAKTLGSDCAFFIDNTPVFAKGKGDEFTNINLDLSNYYIMVVYPNVHSNTAEAYSLVKPQQLTKSITQILEQPISTWKEELVNDFEISIFNKYPIVKQIKETLYANEAVYACMSGSGSAVFGIFKNKPTITELESYPYWIGTM